MKLHVIPSGKDDSILYFAKSVRIGSKTTTKNVKKLGKLSELKKIYEDPISHFKEEARRLTEEGKVESSFQIPQNCMLDPLKTRKIKFGYIFPQSIYYSLGLDNIMRKIKS